jgi:hypothetical protein
MSTPTYTKTTWKDRSVQYPNRYTDESSNVKTFTPSPGTVTEAGTTVTAQRMNNIEDGIANATAYVVPSGGIIMWSGSIANIPSGWALCNGNNGTPNLTDRFIVGAGSSYSVGATGGSATIDTAHTHTFSGTTGETSPGDSAAADTPGTVSFAKIGHDHDYSGTTQNGGSTTEENRPPYYALAYIMKV